MAVNEQKFLITWIEHSGFIRGQATKTKGDADRIFDTICASDPPPQYAEIRRIGNLYRKFGTDGEGKPN